MCKPRRIFIETLVLNSLAEDFNTAMMEWICTGKVYSHEVNFAPNCHLCGAAIYELNYVIFNVKTKKELLIGCDCEKRFKPSHNRIVSKHPKSFQKVKKKYQQRQLKLKLIDQYHFICNQGRPDRLLFDSFCTGLIKLLKSDNKLSLLATSEGVIQVLTKILDQREYLELEIRRLKLILHNQDKARNLYVKRPRYTRKKIDKYGIVI